MYRVFGWSVWYRHTHVRVHGCCLASVLAPGWSCAASSANTVIMVLFLQHSTTMVLHHMSCLMTHLLHPHAARGTVVWEGGLTPHLP